MFLSLVPFIHPMNPLSVALAANQEFPPSETASESKEDQGSVWSD